MPKPPRSRYPADPHPWREPWEHGVRLDRLSIVVLAQQHNPSILNPDFLTRNRIADDAWECVQQICIGGLARVQYSCGITVVSQPDRIVFEQEFRPARLDECVVARMVSRYVRIVPHVVYTAIGTNPFASVQFEDQATAEAFVGDRLLRDANARAYGGSVPSAAVTLRWIYEGGLQWQVQLGATPGGGGGPGRLLRAEGNAHRLGATPGGGGGPEWLLRIEGNAHRDLSDRAHPDRLGAIRRVSGRWETDVAVFRSLVGTTLMEL